MKVALYVLLLIALAIFASFDYQLLKARQEVAQLQGGTRPALGSPSGCSEIRVLGWLDRSLVKLGESTTIWLAVENRSPATIFDLKIKSFNHPNLIETGNCWQSGLPHCRSGDVTPAQSPGLPSELKSGDAATVLAELRPATPAKLEATTAQVLWQEPGRTCESIVTFSPIDVTEPPRRFSAAIYSLLKDLALPVLLGLLAFSLQHSLQAAARTQAVRQALTPRASENILRYIGPVGNAVANLQQAVGKPPDPTVAFFSLVSVLKGMRDMSHGIVLDSLKSERFASDCWSTFFIRVKKRYGYVDITHAMDLLADHESIGQFYSALDMAIPTVQKIAIRRFQRHFLGDLAGGNLESQLLLPALQIMASVFSIESNWLHRGWYEDKELKEQLPAGSLTGWWDTISGIPDDERLRLLESLAQYEDVLLKRQGQWWRPPRETIPPRDLWFLG